MNQGSQTDIAEPTFTLEQNRFLAVRMTVTTDWDAALKVGINPQSVTIWKSSIPAFRQAYDNLGLDIRREAVRSIQRLFDKAISRLAEGLDDPNARTRAKYIELAFSFGGLARAADVNVNVVDRTRLLLEQIRDAGRAAQDADVIDAEPVAALSPGGDGDQDR